MATKEQKVVLDILTLYNDNIKLSIPGRQFFYQYTYKSQMGIMKGHIFYALHNIPAGILGEFFIFCNMSNKPGQI